MEQIGAYRVVRELGRGGAAIVYEVHDSRGEAFALKLLLRSGPRNLARFERELEAMTSLASGGGFVPVLGAGKCPRGAYIVMPLLSGGNLEERLRRGQVPVLDVIDLAERLSEALANAHALGLVHRDLKPANVLFDGVGRALIADLGLAKAMDESQDAALSKTGELRGTLGYAAPEQLRDAKRAGPPADVFALGATLYHCLAGRSPFGHELGSLQEIEAGNAPPLAQLRPETPAWFAALIERCLRPDPAERFSDGAALAAAISAASQAPPSGGGVRVAALLLPCALLLIAGLWLALGRAPHTPTPTPTPSSSLTPPRPVPSDSPSPSASPSPAPPSPATPSPPTAPKPATDLTKDLAGFESFLPLEQFGGGLEEVQGGKIVRVRPTPKGGLLVADEYGFLRVFRGPKFEPQRWLPIHSEGALFDPLPPRVPWVLEISPQGSFVLATVDARTALVRSTGQERTRILLENLPSPLLAGAFTQDDRHLLLSLGQAVVLLDLETRQNSPLVTRKQNVRRIATGPPSEFAIASEGGAIEYCRTPKGGKPSVSLMFRVPNLDRLEMGHERTIFASDRAGKIWFGRPGGRGFVVPPSGRVLGLTFLQKHVLVVTRERFRIFDLATGEAVLQGKLPVPIKTCAPASKRYLFCTLPGSPQTLRVIDLQDRVLYPVKAGHQSAVSDALDLGLEGIAGIDLNHQLHGWRAGQVAWSQRPPSKAYPRLLPYRSQEARWLGTLRRGTLQLLSTTSGEGVSYVKHPSREITAATSREGQVWLGYRDGSVQIVDGLGRGKGKLGQRWELFSKPIAQVLALEGGFVACTRERIGFVRAGGSIRRPAPNLVHPTLCARGDLVFAGTALGDIKVWSSEGKALGQSSGAHPGGVTALYPGPKHLVSGGRGAEIGVWTYGREAGFERVERRPLSLSGERATHLGPAGRPDEFLLGSSRGAIVRCRFR